MREEKISTQRPLKKSVGFAEKSWRRGITRKYNQEWPRHHRERRRKSRKYMEREEIAWDAYKG